MSEHWHIKRPPGLEMKNGSRIDPYPYGSKVQCVLDTMLLNRDPERPKLEVPFDTIACNDETCGTPVVQPDWIRNAPW